MKSIIYIVFLLIIYPLGAVFSQTEDPINTAISKLDSIPTQDSIPVRATDINLSEDAFSGLADYGSDDHSVFDAEKNIVHLYGNAYVKYQSMSITNADYILLDLNKNEATAQVLPDTTKRRIFLYKVEEAPITTTDTLAQKPNEETKLEDQDVANTDNFRDRNGRNTPPSETNTALGGQIPGRKPGKPIFKDGENEVDFEKMRFNFKTKKGMIYEAVTFQQNLFIHGAKTKIIDQTHLPDSNRIIYNKDARITTCTAEHPHFAIHTTKQKIIPNEEIIIGPSNLEIMGIPTPIVLPFGFYPIVSHAKQGLILPQDYEYSKNWGFGLRDIGYYWPINDHVDLKLSGDIYFNGSFSVKAASNYRQRYKYNGNFSLDFANRITTNDATLQNRTDRSFAIRASHNQDANAHPYQNFSANINFQTNLHDKRNYNTAERVLNPRIGSSITYRRRFPGTPFSINASARHSQNASTRRMDITLPSLSVNMKTIYPFKRKKRVGNERWYERVSLNYSSKMDNRVSATDTTIFQPKVWENASNGINHRASLATTLKVFKYINVSPSVSLDESWYLRSIEKSFDNTPTIVQDTVWNMDKTAYRISYDTTSYGRIVTDTLRGFKALHRFSGSLSANTKLFSTWQRSSGYLRGLRGVFTPSASVSFSPNYRDLGYIRSFDYYDGNEWENTEYSIFDGALYGAPSSGKALSISYGFSSTFDAKIHSRRDSTDKKIKLLRSFSVRGGYDPLRDSLRHSAFSVSANSSFFNGLLNMTFSSGFDLYDVDARDRRIDQFIWNTKKRPLRFLQSRLGLSTNFTVGQVRSLLTNLSGTKNEDRRGKATGIFDQFRIRHEISFIHTPKTNKRNDSLYIATNSIYSSGHIKLTPLWGIRVGNLGYDFVDNRITYPDLGFTRDLHCWRMSFNWQPTRGTYSFLIQVKDSPLSDIKIPYETRRQDGKFRGY